MNSIRKKVAIIILVVTMACLLISSLVVSQMTKRQLMLEYGADKEATVGALRSSLLSMLEHYDYNEIELTLKSNLVRRSLAYAAVFDSKGKLVRSVSKKGFVLLELDLVKVDIMSRDNILGRIEIGFTQRYIAGQVRNSALALSAFLLGFFVLMALAFNLALDRWVIQPLEGFASTLDQARPGDLSFKLQYKGKDEFKTLADSFNRMTDKLSAAHHKLTDLYHDLKVVDRMKTEFLSVISHELRTPLTPIKQVLSMFRQGVFGAFPPDYEKGVKAIERQTDHLLSLIDSILDVARLERGISLELKKEPVSLPVLLEGLKEVERSQLEARKVKLEIGLPGDFPTIMADPAKLRRLLTNLIGNAIKFTPEGGWIKVVGAREGGAVRLEVVDDGVGVDKNNLEKMFDKFYQVDSTYTRAAGGAGLGLAIAREIVEAHGGKIWAESEGTGKGLRICFTLPVA
ncbi:ATP-binding protein [Candidatus Margulisiibacteriota bacterium]